MYYFRMVREIGSQFSELQMKMDGSIPLYLFCMTQILILALFAPVSTLTLTVKINTDGFPLAN